TYYFTHIIVVLVFGVINLQFYSFVFLFAVASMKNYTMWIECSVIEIRHIYIVNIRIACGRIQQEVSYAHYDFSIFELFISLNDTFDMICDSDRISIWISIVIIHWIELNQIRVTIEELTDVGEVFLFCLFSVFKRMPSKQIWRFFETITFIDMEIQLSTHDCPI